MIKNSTATKEEIIPIEVVKKLFFLKNTAPMGIFTKEIPYSLS